MASFSIPPLPAWIGDWSISSALSTMLVGIDRPTAADLAFCVAAYANGMTEARIERALEDDYMTPAASGLAPNIAERFALLCDRRYKSGQS